MATVVLTVWWASRDLAGADPLDRATVGALAGLVVLPLVGSTLGMVGLLRTGPLLLALIVVSAAVALARRRGRPSAARGPREPEGRLGLLAVVVVGAVALALSLRLGFDADRSLHFESRHYHLAAVSHFRDAATIWTLPFQNPPVFTASHPALAEVASTLLTFTTDSDRLIYGWIHASSAVLAVLGAASLARELGGRPSAGALSALAVLVSPLGFLGAHSIANDLIPVAGLVTAAALVLRARADDAPRWAMAWAGLALGLALGTKYTAYAGAALVVLAALVVGHRRRLLWLVPGTAVLGLPWLVRNLLGFGNPLYPQRVGIAGVEVFEGGTGPYDQYSGPVLSHLTAWRTDAIDTWLDLIVLLCWPIAIAAIAGTLLVVPCARRRDHRRPIAAVVLSAGLIAAYLVTPYTGGGTPAQLSIMGSNLRYALPALLVGSALLVAVLRKPFDLVVCGALLAWSGWKLIDRPMRPDLELSAPVVAATLLVATATVAAWVLTDPARARRPAPPVRVLAWVLPLAILVATLVADESSSDDAPAPLEASVAAAMARAGAPARAEVAVVGITDLRSITGADFGRQIEQVTDVREPAPFTAEELDRDVEEVEAPVLVVGVHEAGIPDAYVPPADEWCAADVTADYGVYLRQGPQDVCGLAEGGGG